MAYSHPTSIRLDAQVRRCLRQAAKDEKRTMSSMIGKVLHDWMQTYLDRNDPARREPPEQQHSTQYDSPGVPGQQHEP